MCAAVYLGSIVLANVLVHTLGIVSVLGLTFPAGAVAVGLTFSTRDIVQERYGKYGCWNWMLLAIIITCLFNRQLAMASVCAFVVSEFSDWAIYTYSAGNAERRLVLSNLISTPIDSVIFVLLAFGPAWPAVWGQAIVKLASSMLLLPLYKDGRIRSFRFGLQRG